jgi:putative SOS response-associated peptidase YedK
VCSRYSNVAGFSDIKLAFATAAEVLLHEYHPTFNIAPSRGPGHEPLFVTADRGGQRTLRQGRFGLIPNFWTGPLARLPSTFNARSEELERKPFWRQAFRDRRCLVPASGWREFRAESGKKQPWHFTPTAELVAAELFAFAGLWDRWTSEQGEVVDSFTILTTEPSTAAAPFHDRMPLVLPVAEHSPWLSADADAPDVLTRARVACFDLPLVIRATDPIANDARFEGPETLADRPPSPVTVSPQLGLFGSAQGLESAPRARRRSKA